MKFDLPLETCPFGLRAFFFFLFFARNTGDLLAEMIGAVHRRLANGILEHICARLAVLVAIDSHLFIISGFSFDLESVSCWTADRAVVCQLDSGEIFDLLGDFDFDPLALIDIHGKVFRAKINVRACKK